MGSATREALRSATSTLAASSKITLAPGEQLLAAARAIGGSRQLRALLADPAVEPADKSAFIGRVFSALDADATSVLQAAAAQRWSSAGDLVAGVEELGIRALAASAPRSASIESELFAVQAAITSDHELELALGAKLGDPVGKAEIVDALIGGKADAATAAIVRHLVHAPRGRRIGASLRHAAEVVADAAGALVATVTSAAPLSTAQLDRLTASLTAQYGRAPRINLVLDPSILGGLRVQVGDDVVDGSVSARLQDLRIQLAG